MPSRDGLFQVLYVLEAPRGFERSAARVYGSQNGPSWQFLHPVLNPGGGFRGPWTPQAQPRPAAATDSSGRGTDTRTPRPRHPMSPERVQPRRPSRQRLGVPPGHSAPSGRKAWRELGCPEHDPRRVSHLPKEAALGTLEPPPFIRFPGSPDAQDATLLDGFATRWTGVRRTRTVQPCRPFPGSKEMKPQGLCSRVGARCDGGRKARGAADPMSGALQVWAALPARRSYGCRQHGKAEGCRRFLGIVGNLRLENRDAPS